MAKLLDIYLHMNIREVIKEEINDFDWAEGLPDTITTESDIEHFIGRGINEIDIDTNEPNEVDRGKVVDLKYWIEYNGEEPEAYNVCWDEIEQVPPFNTQNVFKVCTRFRASSIVKMFKNGTFRLMPEELDEQVIKEDFDWVKQIPTVNFGKYFDEEDLNERIFFEDDFTKVRYELDFEDFNELVNDGFEDYYFQDLVLYNGTYEDEGDDDWFDDDEINYLPNHLSEDQRSRLMGVLKRSAKLFDLKGSTAIDGGADGPLQTIINDNFWDAEPYIGSRLYRGKYDWDDLTSNFLYYTSKYVNLNRWRSLNQFYLNELKKHNIEVVGDGYTETVSVTVPFPYKTIKWVWVHDENGNSRNIPTEGDGITNLTEILTKGVDSVLSRAWSDFWYEDFDTTGVNEELRPDFDVFIENIEEALDEKENQTNTKGE
jgi:hypothetical protein